MESNKSANKARIFGKSFFRVAVRKCPLCERYMPQHVIEETPYNHRCECGQTRLSDFGIYKWKRERITCV